MSTTPGVPINSFNPINSINPRPLDFDAIAYGSSHLDSLCKDLQCSEDQLEQFLDDPQTQRTLTLRRKLQSFQLQVKSLAAAGDAHAKLASLLEHNNHGTARLAADRLLSLAGLEPPKPETHIHHHITSKPEPTKTKPAVFNSGANVPPKSKNAADPATTPPAQKIENPKWKIENHIPEFLSILLPALFLLTAAAQNSPPPFGYTVPAMKNIYLETFGCQMNMLDSELVESQLKALGYNFTPALDDADVILYNTCSVRERSEQKVWSRLGLLKSKKQADPSLVIGVIGCMAERDGTSLMKRMPQVDLMCGPSELDQLPALLDNVFKTGKQQHALAGNTARRSQTLHAARESDGLELLDLGRSFSPDSADGRKKSQAYIRVVRGCNKFCTYCVVPYTRGPEVSRAPEAILEEAKKLVDAGALEITLLGQTVNHYLHKTETKTTTFAELLHLLHENLPSLQRLRFLTSFPADFGDDILHVMAQSPRICNYLHIPAQSGSNRILKLMNRGYTVESYEALLERARRIVPGIHVAGDFIVGFPTETDDDYVLTRELVERARFKNCFIFKYSERPGTVAIKRFSDDIPEDVKRFRNNDLLRVQNRICKELNCELLGQTVEVLCEGPSGWGSVAGEGSAESIVAGAGRRSSEARESHQAVQLGATLAAGVKRHAELDRHGNVYVAPAQSESRPGWVQLTGRTTHDQIVVFQGDPAWSGRLLDVRVREAHGMTIFGDISV